MSELIWQMGRPGRRNYGPADVVSGEFEEIRAPRHRYTVPSDWKKMKGFGIPRILAHDPSEGCSRLEVEFSLGPGAYAFYFNFCPPSRQTVLQVFFDDRELDVYRTEDIFDATGWRNPVEYRYPFVCEASGKHTLAIDLDLNLNKGAKLYPRSLRVVAEEVTPRAHSLRSGRNPLPAVDLWGWLGGFGFQRDEPADPGYFKAAIVNESRKRGANYVQLNDALELCPWTEEEKKELVRYVHEQDFVVEEHANLHVLAPPNVNVESSRDEQMQWLKTHFKRYGDATSSNWREILDGFEGEGWKVFEDMPSMHRELWAINPGMYMEEMGFKASQEADLDMSIWIDMYVLNRPNSLNYIKGVMCCHFLARTFMPKPGLSAVGYDDKNPIRLFPERMGLTGEWGYVHLAYQADIRPVWYPGGAGGGSFGDWVVKQAHDFLRPRVKEEKSIRGIPLETCLFWLGESPFTTPPEVREYAYAATQDALRGALAFELKATGKHGYRAHKLGALKSIYDSTSRMVYQKLGTEQTQLQHLTEEDMLRLWILRPSCDYPSDTHVIQNNHLRLNILPSGDRILQYDLEHLSHFDSNSLSIMLADQFLCTEVSGRKGKRKEIFVVEKGGYRSGIAEDWEYRGNSGPTLRERRRYEMISDTPYVRVILERKTGDSSDRINRIKEKQCGPVRTRLNTKGYDRLVTGRKKWNLPTSGKTGDVPGILSLEDSSGFRPPLFVLLIEKGQISEIEWNTGGELSLVSKRVKDEKIDIAVVVGTDLYSRQDMPELCEFLKEKRATFSCQTVSVLVRNERKIPVVKVVRMEGAADDQPYMVEENGWWQVRGAQRALDDTGGIDWLKLYVPAKGSVRVQSYGFVGGAAKPGWGCQYTVSLGKISKKAGKTRCRVRVVAVTPYVFAPRVEFSGQIASARVNGRDWHYFDEGLLFLPNVPGDYDVEIEEGKPRVPHLTRTFALVSETSWDGTTFTFTADLPPWSKKMHPDSVFYAVFDIGARKPCNIEGAIQTGSGDWLEKTGIMVKHRTGVVKVDLD